MVYTLAGKRSSQRPGPVHPRVSRKLFILTTCAKLNWNVYQEKFKYVWTAAFKLTLQGLAGLRPSHLRYNKGIYK